MTDFNPNDPSLMGDQFGVPGVDEQAIAASVAQAMAGLGKRAAFDDLGSDPMGRQVFDPSNPNAAQSLAANGQVPQTQPAQGTPQAPPAEPTFEPPQQPAQPPAQSTPQQQAPDQNEVPEGIDPELWGQFVASQTGDDVPESPAQPTPQQSTQPTTPDGQQPPAQPQPDEVPPGGIDVELGGQKYHLDADQVTYLLQVNSWLESQPDEVKQQWSAIQQGQSVAISREEYQRMQQANEQAQRLAQFQQQNPAQQAAQLQNEPDLELLDDETANYIRDLKQRLAQQPTMDAPPQQPQQQPIQPHQEPGQQYDQRAMYEAAQRQAQRDQQNREVLTTTIESYKNQYDLDDAQVDRLTRVVAESNMVPVLAQRYAVRSPLDGSVISEAPFDQVVGEAFSMAMATDSELQQVHNDYIFNQRLAAENSANQRVAAKRGKAGSLAASPSAAVPAANGQGGVPPIGPGNQMNLPAMTAAIASAIEQAQSGG